MNALIFGYLDLMDKKLLGGHKWLRSFAVLSNVGLLYFKDPLQAPNDLFPVMNCDLVAVDPERVGGDSTVFRLQYPKK